LSFSSQAYLTNPILSYIAVTSDDDGDVDDVAAACSVTEFTCQAQNGKKCVPRWKCNDGVNDCGDNTDETICGTYRKEST